PIRKGDKFYILKVTDRKIPTFEQSREQLLKSTRAQKSYSRAVEIATAAEEKFKANKDAQSTVSEINKSYGAPVAEVKETPFFVQGDSLPDLGAASEFESSVFDLSNTSDVGDHINVSSGFAIPQYVEKRDPHVPTFEEVRSKVEDRYRTEKAKDIALERARQLAGSQTVDALKNAATAMGLKIDGRPSVTGNDSIGPLVGEDTRARIYKLNPGEITREPIKAENSDIYVVAMLIGRKDADMGDAFQKQ